MSSSEIPVIPCVFNEQEATEPKGSLVYFHPGGLPAKIIEHLKERFPRWNIYRVELMLCAPYVESINRKNELKGSIKEIGEVIRQHLLKEKPLLEESPLVFMGWSFGGVIAFEIAANWQSQSKPKLIFIDSIAPVTTQSFSEQNIASKQTLKWFKQYLQCLKNCQLSLNLPRFGAVDGDSALQGLLNQCQTQGVFDPQTKFVAFKKVFTTFTQGLIRNSRLAAEYEPEKYSGNLLLIRAKQGLLLRFKLIKHMGWRGLVGRLNKDALNFDHYQVINDRHAINKIVDFTDAFISG